jgi:hypothetical protein
MQNWPSKLELIDSTHIQIVAGGEISARFISPKPFGTPPLPKSQWIKRSELLKRSSWKLNQREK